MNLQKIYTALRTADLAAAEGWYTKLLGRGPDQKFLGSRLPSCCAGPLDLR